MKIETVAFIVGWSFFGIAEIAPLFDSASLMPLFFPNDPTTRIPLAAFAYDTDFFKPLFMFSTVPAIWFLFLSFSYLKASRLFVVGLQYLATWTVFLAIPDMIWPLGSIYYETLKYYFGVLSLFMAFLTILLYCFVVWRDGK